MAIVITDTAVERLHEIAERLRKRVREAVAAGHPAQSLAELETWLAVNRRALIVRVAEELGMESAPLDVPEEWTPGRRTERNLAAMRLIATKSPTAMTAEDRAVLAAYNGWGGLSIVKVKELFPPSLEVDPESLIHEYYTPFELCMEMARVVQPLLSEIAGMDGVIGSVSR